MSEIATGYDAPIQIPAGAEAGAEADAKDDAEVERLARALLTCAPLTCPRERACFRLAQYVCARLQREREHRAQVLNETLLEQYAISQLYAAVGGWEGA